MIIKGIEMLNNKVEMELRTIIEGLDDRMNKLDNRIKRIEGDIYGLKKKNWGVSKVEGMGVEK